MGDFSLQGRFLAPGSSRKHGAASKEVSEGEGKPTAPEPWPEISGRGLDGDFRVEHFPVKSCLFLCFFRRVKGLTKSGVVQGGAGKPKAPKSWPESFSRGLDNNFLIEAFFCQVWSFSVILGRLEVAPGAVELHLRRSQEVRGSLQL